MIKSENINENIHGSYHFYYLSVPNDRSATGDPYAAAKAFISSPAPARAIVKALYLGHKACAAAGSGSN